MDLYFYVAQPLHEVEEEEGKDDENSGTQGQSASLRSLDDALLRRRTPGKMSSFLERVQILSRLFHRCALPEMCLLYNALYNWSTAWKNACWQGGGD